MAGCSPSGGPRSAGRRGHLRLAAPVVAITEPRGAEPTWRCSCTCDLHQDARVRPRFSCVQPFEQEVVVVGSARRYAGRRLPGARQR